MLRRLLSTVVFLLIISASSESAPVHLNAGSPLPGDVPFSAAVRHGDVLYLSGQIGVLPGTRTLPSGGVRAEAQQAIRNIEAILLANDRSLRDLIRCTVMFADMAEWSTFNEVWMAMLEKPYPARIAFGVNGLALGAQVEIECTASAT